MWKKRLWEIVGVGVFGKGWLGLAHTHIWACRKGVWEIVGDGVCGKGG